MPVTFQEKINIIPEYYELLRERLKVKKVIGKNFVRVGRPNDGGYILVDNFNVSSGRHIAYSFGINDDVSWDLDMAQRLTHCRRRAINFIFSRKVFLASRFQKNLCTRWIIS